MQIKCGNCRYFERNEKGILTNNKPDTGGDCRRYPPILKADCFSFPVVSDKKWCGEHKYRKDA